MKTTKFFFVFFILAALLTGCRKKYEEDPFTMRFVNLGKRIEGEWSINKILIDGADSTSIIYVDSLQIFSTYIFSNYSHTYSSGSLKAKTYNGLYFYEYLEFKLVDCLFCFYCNPLVLLVKFCNDILKFGN